MFRKLGEIPFTNGTGRIDKLNFSLSIREDGGNATDEGDAIVENLPTTLGSAPLYIVVNGDRTHTVFWPSEANNIGMAYPQFSIWGSNVQSAIDWYDSANATKSRIVTY